MHEDVAVLCTSGSTTERVATEAGSASLCGSGQAAEDTSGCAEDGGSRESRTSSSHKASAVAVASGLELR
jgi:hypothetical protein